MLDGDAAVAPFGSVLVPADAVATASVVASAGDGRSGSTAKTAATTAAADDDEGFVLVFPIANGPIGRQKLPAKKCIHTVIECETSALGCGSSRENTRNQPKQMIRVITIDKPSVW